jgi:hypothetical protein
MPLTGLQRKILKETEPTLLLSAQSAYAGLIEKKSFFFP